jgi:DNA-binding transcriptional LysR family regulator
MQKFSAAGLQPRFVMQALDSDVMKAYVSAGLGIAIIPKISFSPRRDSGLRSRDVSHLFTPTTTYAIFRRGVYLKKHVQEFIQSVAPQLDRKTLEDAIAQTGGSARLLADAGLAPAPDGE